MRNQAMKPALPDRPESVESLLARYPAALEVIHDEEEMRAGTVLRPSEKCANIFDFEDGVRLIVSRTREAEHGQVLLHFSASIRPGSPFQTRATEIVRSSSVGALLDELVRHYYLLAGPCVVEFLGFSDGKGVPHWQVLEAP